MKSLFGFTLEPFQIILKGRSLPVLSLCSLFITCLKINSVLIFLHHKMYVKIQNHPKMAQMSTLQYTYDELVVLVPSANKVKIYLCGILSNFLSFF